MEHNTRKGLLLTEEKQPCGDLREEITVRNACEGKPGKHGEQGDSAESQYTVGGAICIGSRSTDVSSGQLKNPREDIPLSV